MSPKSFFLILIKIMGIFLLYKIFVSFGNSFSFYNSRLYYGAEFTFEDKLFFTLPFVVLFIAIVYFFIINPNLLIKLFRLDKDFDEEKFELNIDKTSILKIAVIVTGGIMFVNNLPYIVYESIKYFQLSVLNINENNKVIYSIVAAIIGFLLMTSSKKIVDFIVKKEKSDDKINVI